MALDPELLRRRQRRPQKRGPERTLGKGVSELTADEKLEVLLDQLLEEAKLQTLFTLTLERDRLFSALFYAGFIAPLWVNTEIQLGPLATTTVFVAVPPGFVVVPRRANSVTSLPWWLTSSIWIDSDPPALPSIFFLRGPEIYEFEFGGLVPVRRYLRLTVTNLHVANTANLISMMEAGLLTEAAWNMLEAIYLQPIAEYAQEKAEELTGRPFP